MPDSVLHLQDIRHAYADDLVILNRVELDLKAAELVALMGSSGMGKSTLLHIAGLMETPTAGQVTILGKTAKDEQTRTLLRLRHIGFVFQSHHLLPEFTALGNVALVGRIGGLSKRAARGRAKELLERVGLSHRLKHVPAELSGGECQRVALARALINQPQILLLDEPTGNLDANTAQTIFALIEQVVHQDKLACLYVTHNLEQAARADRRLTLRDKKVVCADA